MATPSSSPIRLRAIFLHDSEITKLVAEDDLPALQDALDRRALVLPPEAARAGVFEKVLETTLETRGNVPELSAELVAGTLQLGQLVTFTQALYTKRLSATRGAFHHKLDVDSGITVEGEFSIERLVGQSGLADAFGSSRRTVIGYVEELDADRIQVRPIFLGARRVPVASGYSLLMTDRASCRLSWLTSSRAFKTSFSRAPTPLR